MRWLGYMETRVRRNTRPMRYWGTPLRRETEGLTGALHTDPHQADSIRKLRLSILGQTLWVCRAKLREKTEREAATTLAGLVIGSSADLTFPFRALLSSLYGLSAAVYTRLHRPHPLFLEVSTFCPAFYEPLCSILRSFPASGNNWSPIISNNRRIVAIKLLLFYLSRSSDSIISSFISNAISFNFFFYKRILRFIRHPWWPIIDYRIFFFFWIARDKIKKRFQTQIKN